MQEAQRVAVAQRQQGRLGLNLIVGERHGAQAVDRKGQDAEKGHGGRRHEASRAHVHAMVVGIGEPRLRAARGRGRLKMGTE